MSVPHHRGPMEHELKCWPDFFSKVVSGEKTFELREDDRGFQAGDTLWLREYNNPKKAYTGRECVVDVPYLLAGQWPGLNRGHVVMSIRLRSVLFGERK